jgi:hypothetical protein
VASRTDAIFPERPCGRVLGAASSDRLHAKPTRHRLRHRVPSSCDTVLGRDRYYAITFRAGGRPVGGHRADTARIALAVMLAQRSALMAHANSNSACQLQHGGDSTLSGKHLGRAFALVLSALLFLFGRCSSRASCEAWGKRAHSELITHARSSASSRACRVWNYFSAADAGATDPDRHRQVPLHKEDSWTRSASLCSGNRGARRLTARRAATRCGIAVSDRSLSILMAAD